MGAGASSTRSKDTDNSGLSQDTASTTCTSANSQWLVAFIEKEKREKEWLAQKYEEKCAEANALREILARGRASAETLVECGAKPVETTRKALQVAVEPRAASEAQDMSPGLAQRRCLALSVQTSAEVQPSPTLERTGADVPGMVPEGSVQGVSAERTEAEWSSGGEAGNRRGQRSKSELECAAVAQSWALGDDRVTRKDSLMSRRSISKGPLPLVVEKTKIFSMVDEDLDGEPVSPKRTQPRQQSSKAF